MFLREKAICLSSTFRHEPLADVKCSVHHCVGVDTPCSALVDCWFLSFLGRVQRYLSAAVLSYSQHRIALFISVWGRVLVASDESNKAYSGDSASIVVGSSEAYKKRVTENLGLLGLPIEESREDYNLPHGGCAS